MSNTNEFLTFRDRLIWARTQKGLTQEQVADLSGMSQGNYSRLERTGIGSSYVVQLAMALEVSPAWLSFGDGAAQHAVQEGLLIPEIELDSTFSGLPFTDGDPVLLKRTWLERRKLDQSQLHSFTAVALNMIPTIHPGDAIIVNAGDTTPQDGQVFAINLENSINIYRLTRDAGAWWMDSDNQDKVRHPRKILLDQSVIMGRVIYKQTEFI